MQGDIADTALLRELLKGTDLVIHLAAESHNDRAIKDPLPFIRTNVLGTATLLEGCRIADVPRFHHVSTDEVFGSLSLDQRTRFTERTPYAPRGPYSASKAASDHLVRAWAETYGARVTVSNCGNNFGPYQFPEKLIPLAITRLILGRKVPVYGDGKNVRDWIYVQDHCAALDLISHEGAIGETYIVSGSNERSNLEVVDQVLVALGRDRRSMEYVSDRPGHDRRYALDSSKLARELGWKPEHTFEDAIKETVRWYQGNSEWWGPLLDSPDEPLSQTVSRENGNR